MSDAAAPSITLADLRRVHARFPECFDDPRNLAVWEAWYPGATGELVHDNADLLVGPGMGVFDVAGALDRAGHEDASESNVMGGAGRDARAVESAPRRAKEGSNPSPTTNHANVDLSREERSSTNDD